MTGKATILAMALWALGGFAFGQVPDLGAPILTNYEPEQFKASSQTWVAVQDRRGVLYFGNSAGVLEFDGQRWQLIPTPGNPLTRSLAAGPDGTIYYGSIGDIGYLAVSPTGKISAVSLKEALPPSERSFNDVWQVESCADGIYFLTRSKIFRFHGGRITALPGLFASSQACVLNGTLFYADIEKGICLVDGDKVVPLPGLAGVYNGKRINMAPFGRHELLVGRLSGDFRRIDLSALWDETARKYDSTRPTPKGMVQPFPTELDAFLPDSQAFIYKLVPLGADAFAICTVKAGIIIFGRDGKIIRAINKDSGLPDNTVAGLLVDRSNNLWATTNSGICHIELSVPQSIFGARNGIDGISLSMGMHKGRLYVGTFQNLYVQAPYTFTLKKDVPTFVAVKDSPNEVWQFMEVDGDLMVASSRGLFRIQDEAAIKVPGSSTNALCLGISRRWPGHLFVGMMGGVEVFRRVSDQWALVGKLGGVRDNIRRITQDADGDLWLSTEVNGLLRAHFSGNTPTDAGVHGFGPEHGLPGLTGLNASFHGTTLYVLSLKGLYHAIIPPWDANEPDQTRFAPDLALGKAFSDPPTELKTMVPDGKDGIFFSTSRGVVWARPGRDGQFQLTTGPFRGLTAPDEPIFVHPNGSAWLTGKTLYRVDPWAAKDYDQRFEVLIRKVVGKSHRVVFEGTHSQEGTAFRSKRTVFRTDQGGGAVPELPYGQNALAFEFAAAFFERPGTTQFQYLLEGFDKDWSEWGTVATKEYTNLPERNYRFRVRAKNLYGTPGQEAQYGFRILAPWYRTIWAYLAWISLGSMALVGIVYGYTRKLQRQKWVLEALVTRRTAELKLAKDGAELAKDAAELAREAAERANAFKSTFLATTTHELRTPLNAIIGFSRMLVQGDVREAERRDFSRTIWGAAESLLQLVNDLLDLNKIEAGKLDVERVPVDLRQILEEALVLMGTRAQERNLLLLCEVDPEVPDRMLGDPLRIRQMLVNLLGNAVKFTHQGCVRVRMALVEGPRIRVEVQDTGEGIPSEILPRLFQAFTQAESMEKSQGTGLGLSITRHLAELMGGDTGVTSTVGEGSTFWFSLPVDGSERHERARPWAGRRFAMRIQNAVLAASLATHARRLGAEAADEAVPDLYFVEHPEDLPLGFAGEGILVVRPGEIPRGDASLRILNHPFGEPAFLGMAIKDPAATETEGARHQPGEALLQARVLLADDNHANRLLAQAVFQQLGVDFTLAGDGQRALTLFQSDRYDVVILDANMPRMGGLEAMKAMRALPGGREVPILVFTASASDDLRQKYLAEGFDDFLIKPADFDDFRRALAGRIRRAGPTPPMGPSAPETAPTGAPLQPRPRSGFEPARLARLAQAMGGPASGQDFVRELLEDCRDRFARLDRAIPSLDRVQIERQAHDLKSNAANLGLLVLTQAAAMLEAEAPAAEPERLARLQGALADALVVAMEDIAAYFQTGPRP
ncbi:MAG: response regulator [Holophagaceae bacterium]|nr:response regulator [Holophagaceae bacterium]